MRDPEDWQQLDEAVVFEKYGRAVVERHFRLPSGKIDTFTVRVEPPTVAVVALTENGDVVLTRQYRPGPKRVIYELPGGYVEDEDIKTAAERELAEETGYVGDVSVVGNCFSDSYSASSKFCGVARNVAQGAERHLDPEEFIKVAIVSLAEFRQLLREGNIADVDLGYMGLDWLGLLLQENFDNIRPSWTVSAWMVRDKCRNYMDPFDSRGTEKIGHERRLKSIPGYLMVSTRKLEVLL